MFAALLCIGALTFALADDCLLLTNQTQCDTSPSAFLNSGKRVCCWYQAWQNPGGGVEAGCHECVLPMMGEVTVLKSFLAAFNVSETSHAAVWDEVNPDNIACPSYQAPYYCEDDGRILGVALPFRKLSGPAADLCVLKDLPELDLLILHDNGIFGDLAQCFDQVGANGFKQLDLSNNYLSGALPVFASSWLNHLAGASKCTLTGATNCLSNCEQFPQACQRGSACDPSCTAACPWFDECNVCRGTNACLNGVGDTTAAGNGNGDTTAAGNGNGGTTAAVNGNGNGNGGTTAAGNGGSSGSEPENSSSQLTGSTFAALALLLVAVCF